MSTIIRTGEILADRGGRAFTQLAADNQYAHLGLALIGVLAQVNTAIAPWAPALSEVAEKDVQVLLDTAGLASSKDAHDAADLGIAVSRSDIEQRVLATTSKVEQRVEDSGKGSRGMDVAGLSPKEEISTRIEAQERPKKSKKRKDEFDSLFDSLEPKKTVKKKKKLKKGDEFDNLFSSLI
jgi:ribonuclease MRP protein subunit RMP1